MTVRFARSAPPATIAELVDAQHRYALALSVVAGPVAVASVYVGVAFAMLVDEFGPTTSRDTLRNMVSGLDIPRDRAGEKPS